MLHMPFIPKSKAVQEINAWTMPLPLHAPSSRVGQIPGLRLMHLFYHYDLGLIDRVVSKLFAHFVISEYPS